MNTCFSQALPKLFLGLAVIAAPIFASAAGASQNGFTISKIRAVGDYPGTTFDNTIELWFTAPLNPYPAGTACTSTFRVYVDAKHKHLVSAAYVAMTTGKKVDLFLDDTLPVRDGACEVAYLDIVA